MPTQPWCGSRSARRRAVASLVVLVALTLGSPPTFAQILDDEVAIDSELQMLERAGGGAYQRYSISLSSKNGVVTLTTNKDGAVSTQQVPVGQYVALWRGLLNTDLETLQNVSVRGAAPDQSRFSVKYRAAAASGEFSAYGVDSLADTRYRTIVRAVLDFATTHSK